MLLESLPAFWGADFAQHVAHLFEGEGFLANGHDLSVAANFGRLTLTEVKIRCTTVYENLKKLVDVSHIIGVR